MTEQNFWALIEEAWLEVAPKLASRRQEIAFSSEDMKEESKLGLELESTVDNEIVKSLTTILKNLPQAELKEFDRILEQKLYDIDREDIQEFTDGSDDGFLYVRGFIVGMGEEGSVCCGVRGSICVVFPIKDLNLEKSLHRPRLKVISKNDSAKLKRLWTSE